MRTTSSRSAATSHARAAVPSDSSVSGSRCVWTETTSGTSSRIARSTCSAIACAASSERSAGSLRCSESSVPLSSATAVTLCTSRTLGTPSAAAWARSRTAPTASSGSTWTTTSASGSAAWTARSTASAAACPCRIPASAETPLTTSAKWRPAAWRMRSRRRSTGGRIAAIARRAAAAASAGALSMSTSALRRIKRPAAARTSIATNSAAAASPFGCPARARSRPASTATEPARSLAKWMAFEESAALWYCFAACAEAVVLATSTRITTPITSSAHQAACTGRGWFWVRRITARMAMKMLAITRNAASASAARCSAFPCPYGWPRSAGRPETPTAKNVSSAATRSVPEWIASETRPRLCVASPTDSLSAISVAAATTDVRAARRCGLTLRLSQSTRTGAIRAAAMLAGPPPVSGLALLDGDRLRPALPHALEDDADRDCGATGDLPSVQLFGEEHEREEDGEERLQVREQGRTGRPDAVDRREPEDVGQEERPDHRVGERDPHQRAEVAEALRGELRDADEYQREPAERQHDCADPQRRIAAHQRGDRDRIGSPGRRRRDRDQVAEPIARDAAAPGDQPDAEERDGGGEPERRGRPFDPDDEREDADEHRRRPEHEADRRRRRQVHAGDEARLVQEDEQRRQPDELPVRPADPERPLALCGEAPEERRRREVADRRVGERTQAVREQVARRRHVQGPEENGSEQHQIDHARAAVHRPTLPGAARPPDGV